MPVKSIEEISKLGFSVLSNLTKKSVESVISISREGKEWKVISEVLERKSVPDSQDLLGRYELRFDENGKLLGYKQVMLRRRVDRLELEEK